MKKFLLLLSILCAFCSVSAFERGDPSPFTQEVLIEMLTPGNLLKKAPLVELSTRIADGEPHTRTARWQLYNGFHYYTETAEYTPGTELQIFCVSDDPEDGFIYRMERYGALSAVPFDTEGFPILFNGDILGLGLLEPESYAVDIAAEGLWRSVFEGFSNEAPDAGMKEWTLLFDPETERFLSAECSTPGQTPQSTSFFYDDSPEKPVFLPKELLKEKNA